MTTAERGTITTGGLHWHTLTHTGNVEPGIFEHITGTPRMDGEYFDSATFSRKALALSYAEVQQVRAERHGLNARTDLSPCLSQCAIYPRN